MHFSRLVFFLSFCLFTLSCSNSEKKETNATEKKISETLSPQEFKSKLESIPGAVVVDVRTPEEISTGFLKGAINIDFKDPTFEENIKTLDKSKPYFVYCLSGKRSGSAAEIMEEAGFNEVYTLEDGLQRWKKEGLPTIEPQ